MPQNALVLGLDVGTTNLKCLALDDAGTIVAQGSEPTPRSHPRPDWTDFEPGPIWEAACRAIRSVVSQIKNPAAIGGIAVSSLAESVVPIDSRGQPLAPAIAWYDLRTIAEYEWLRDTIGYETLFKISGVNPDPMFGLCKILWVKKHDPATFKRLTIGSILRTTWPFAFAELPPPIPASPVVPSRTIWVEGTGQAKSWRPLACRLLPFLLSVKAELRWA